MRQPGLPPVLGKGQYALLGRCGASVPQLGPLLPPVRAFGPLCGPPLPAADSSHGINPASAWCSQFPWHATARGAGRPPVVRGHPVRAETPNVYRTARVWMEGFAVACPLAPAVPHLLSGACPSSHTFVPRGLQTPPRGDALALPLAFGSTYTWTGTFTPEHDRMHGTHARVTCWHGARAVAGRVQAVVRFSGFRSDNAGY